MSSLFQELQRRNVFRVAAAYIIVAWLLAQVADLALENFGAPDWVMKTILLLMVLGLPVAILFAWAFEMTPEGIKREKDVERDESITASTGQRLNYAIVGLLAVALVYFIYESRFSDREAFDDLSPAVTVQDTRSIAVLPFATFGNNEADGYLSDGLAETLLNLLAQIDELQVAARTSAFKFKNTNEDIRVIGEQLGVETVLEGSVQRSGNRIRITAQLINVDDGFHMYSETFEREVDDIFAVQDEIANAVVDALEVELLGAAAHKNPDFEAFDKLARLRSKLRTSVSDEMAQVIESLEDLTRDYPTYADAFATLSTAYTLNVAGAGLIPEETAEKGIAAGRKAIDLEPENAEGYVALAQALRGRGMFKQAAPVVARALEIQPGNADLLAMQGALLAIDGKLQEAFEVTNRALLRDPLNPDTRGALADRHHDLGNVDKALAVLDGGIEIEPGDIPLQLIRALFLEEKGDFRNAMEALDEILLKDPAIPNAQQSRFNIYFDAGNLESAREALERGESISVERLADERALYCYVLDDTECWHTATALMLATRDRFFVQNWQSRMLYEGGLLSEAIAALLPVVEYFDETNDPYGNLETRTNLAALYQLNGDTNLGAEALDPVINSIETSMQNGYGHHELYRYRAAAAVVSGDVDGAIELLEEAYARGFRHPSKLYYLYAFDQLRDDLRFQDLLARIYSENAEQLSGL